MLADLRRLYLEWRLQRQALKPTGKIYDSGWYEALQLQWPSLQWTGDAVIPTKAILTHWWCNRARALGSDVTIGKQLTSVPRRKPKSLECNPPMLGLLDAVQMEISEGKQLEGKQREIKGKPLPACLIV